MAKGNLALGTIYLELNQQRFQPGNAYPRLLLDQQYAEKLQEDPFDFAVFRSGEVIRSSETSITSKMRLDCCSKTLP